jgi:hypothetical protein
MIEKPQTPPPAANGDNSKEMTATATAGASQRRPSPDFANPSLRRPSTGNLSTYSTQSSTPGGIGPGNLRRVRTRRVRWYSISLVLLFLQPCLIQTVETAYY